MRRRRAVPTERTDREWQRVNLEELQQKSIAKIAEELDELTVAQLRELRALEELSETPRSTLLEKIDAKLADLDGPSSDAAAEAAAEAEAPPAWQDPAYSGTLTGDQAAWRNTHLDPSFRAPATKPVTGGETK